MANGRVVPTAAVLGLGAACVAYGTFVERRWFRLREEHLTGALRHVTGGPLRVLLVTDTHLSPPDPAMAGFVERLAELEADLVVAGGDLLGAAEAEDAVVELLEPLTSGGRPGVAVLGSNDLFRPVLKSPHVYFTAPEARRYGPRHDTDRLRRGLAGTGWTVLENARAVVETTHGAVEVAGLRDPHLRDVTLPPPDEILAHDPAAVLRLGVVHAPYRRALDVLAGAGYEVLLAGHTHGGQVRLPPFGALVTNCDLSTRRARGTSHWAGSYLHVSAGLGQSRYAPFRFACRPEASLLTLT